MSYFKRRPYEAPEAEDLVIKVEASFLQSQTPQLDGSDEDDYGDFD